MGERTPRDFVRAWPPVTSLGAPSPPAARTTSAPPAEQGLGAPVTEQRLQAGEGFPLVPPVVYNRKPGLRPAPSAPPQLRSIPARNSQTTTPQNTRHPRVPPSNLPRPDEIAPVPGRNRPVPGRNARVPGRNLRLPARNGVLPSRNTSVPGRNLPSRPRNRPVPTRLEHLPRGNRLLNFIAINMLQGTKGSAQLLVE